MKLDLPPVRKSKNSKKKLTSVLKTLKSKSSIHKVAAFVLKACAQAIAKERRFCIKFLHASKK